MRHLVCAYMVDAYLYVLFPLGYSKQGLHSGAASCIAWVNTINMGLLIQRPPWWLEYIFGDLEQNET